MSVVYSRCLWAFDRSLVQNAMFCGHVKDCGMLIDCVLLDVDSLMHSFCGAAVVYGEPGRWREIWGIAQAVQNTSCRYRTLSCSACSDIF